MTHADVDEIVARAWAFETQLSAAKEIDELADALHDLIDQIAYVENKLERYTGGPE